MDEGFTSGSSIMPAKDECWCCRKNKEVKPLKVLGLFVTTCVAMKGTPSGYNKDSAETKLAILDSLKEVISTVKIANGHAWENNAK